jgi:hypothetical protein
MEELQTEDVVAWLRSRSDKSLVDVFYQAVNGRSLSPLANPEYESHFVLTHVSRNSEAPGDWEIEFIGLPPVPAEWSDETLIANEGEHCFQTVVSYAERFACPLCGGEASGT